MSEDERFFDDYGNDRCVYQTGSGEEPCCDVIYADVLNSKSPARVEHYRLERQPLGLASTACIPGCLGSVCADGIEEARERILELKRLKDAKT